VKKWGLAPSAGTLAPPPAYGSERGSILLETADGTVQGLRMTMPNAARRQHREHQRRRPRTPHGPGESSNAPVIRRQQSSSGSEAEAESLLSSHISEDPEEEEVLADSPRDHFSPRPNRRRMSSGASSTDFPHNPPTPNVMDISLHSLHNISPFSQRLADEENPYDRPPPTPTEGSPPSGGSSRRRSKKKRTVQPPGYNVIDPNVYAEGVSRMTI
jgi:hypothetical protein